MKKLLLLLIFTSVTMLSFSSDFGNLSKNSYHLNLSNQYKYNYLKNQSILTQNRITINGKSLQIDLKNKVSMYSINNFSINECKREAINLYLQYPDDPPEHKSGGVTLFGKLFLGGLVGSGTGLLLGMMATANGEGEIAPWIIGGGIVGAIGFALAFD